MTAYQIFGENIRKVREYKNLTITALANNSKYYRSGITRLENGESDISYKTAVSLAKVLNVDFPLLFSRTFDINMMTDYIDTDYMNIFSENILQILKSTNKTQYSILAKEGMDAGNFNRLLKCKVIPRISTLEKISNAFNQNLSNLFVRGGI